jgi:phosphoribosylanthranilate isomerase
VTIVSKVGLHGVQLHGHEPLSEVRWIRERVPFVIQAFTAGDPALAAAANGPADAVLIDSPNPGSGRVFDWTLAEGAPGGVKLILSGGLTHDNVAEAIARVRPWGVDVSSGVEATPGRKDARKLRLFVEEAQAAGELLADAHLPRRQALDEGEPLVDLVTADGGPGPVRDRPFDWMLDA